MGKGDRKTRAKRNRAAFEAAAGLALAPVPRKPKAKARGRARMAEITRESEQDAVRVVCEARARQIGWNGDTAAMRSQSHGDAAGRAILIFDGGDKGKELVAAYRALTAAYERYCRRCLGVSPYAKTGKIEMMPEKLETSADAPPPDLRTEDQRHSSAVNAWSEWKDRLATLPLRHSSAIWSAVYGFTDLHDGPKLTPAGERFVAAMGVLVDRMR